MDRQLHLGHRRRCPAGPVPYRRRAGTRACPYRICRVRRRGGPPWPPYYCVVEREPDGDLRDSDQVPLLEEGGSEAFLRREVLPHAADAWYDPASVNTGYEICLTCYICEPQPLRTLEEIGAGTLALEREAEGQLGEIIGGGQRPGVK